MPTEPNTFYIGTLGCKLNIYESEAIAGQLTEAGWTEIKDMSAAQLIFINTCTVTSKADAKCRNFIRRARKASPDAIIAVAGCMVTSRPEIAASLPEADIFLDNRSKSHIADAVTDYMSRRTQLWYNCGSDGRLDYSMQELTQHSRAFIKVEDGCTNFCSYCRIPFARGPNISRPLDDIMTEVQHLTDNGFREFVITGVNTGSYRTADGDFTDLLNRLTSAFKECRFRVSSIEPQYVDDGFLRVLAKPNVCAHLHIPIQSGSDKILRLMERRYTVAEYEGIIRKVREAKPDLFLATDLIVGFPSEDETAWAEILDTVRRINFTYIHVFGFSPREGTKAYSFGNKTPERIRDERVSIIQHIANENTQAYRRQNVGLVTTAVAEQKKGSYWTGKTDNYLDIRIRSCNPLQQRAMYRVKLSLDDNGVMWGDVINS